jgi:hypothetical protein
MSAAGMGARSTCSQQFGGWEYVERAPMPTAEIQPLLRHNSLLNIRTGGEPRTPPIINYANV